MADDADASQFIICGHCDCVTKVPEHQFAPRTLIDEFVIKKALGHGGMGTVYLAHQLSLDRMVALKVLMSDFARSSEFIRNFIREARIAAQIVHPNIVQSYKVGEWNGVYFFAMEYVNGRTLKEIVMQEGPVHWRKALDIIRQTASALDAAWRELQLVHRDIKPDNILVDTRGVAKLADLGLAMAAQETITDDDEVMGTPQFISPEQILGNAMDVRSDLYSLGASLFYVLTANFPYTGNDARDIVTQHLQAPIPNPCNLVPEIPPTVGEIVMKLLAKRIEDRYEDPMELMTAIDTALAAPETYTRTRNQTRTPGTASFKTTRSIKTGKTKKKIISKKLRTSTRHRPE